VHAEATTPTQRPLVLVVDDQPFFRAQMRNELARRGYTVVTAHDAAHAQRLVDELGPPLVLVLDLILPGTSGAELLEVLSGRADAEQLRFILVSAQVATESVAPDNRLVIARLRKPVNLERLAERLEAAGVLLCGPGAD
jgi:CheY-like chemotaxis protein